MANLDAFRKLIREELRTVLKQELPKLLKESKQYETSGKTQLKEQVAVRNNIPGTLNTSRPSLPKFGGNGPMAALLNDTAQSMMLNEDYSMTSDNMHPSMVFQPKEDNVGSVQSMLSTARPSSNLDMVQINEVPDFSGLMNKLKQNGQI